MTAMAQDAARSDAPLAVRYEGVAYPAAAVAHGAAYELFGAGPGPGWLPNPRLGARYRYRRFVPAGEVDGAPDQGGEEPLRAPVSRSLSWEALHRLSQRPAAADSAIWRVRATAAVRRGTRMVRLLTAAGLGQHLTGALPGGFCYREHDIAHLRTPADLAVLGGDGADAAAVFALRWRAIDPADYAVPAGPAFAGLVAMPAHARTGPPVIGTGFAPAARQLIPEFVTHDLADLPLPNGAALLAYTADGNEVPLFSYLPEQRTWLRMYGPQWRHLLAASGVGDQEYFPLPAAVTTLVGRHRGRLFEAVADPPDEFRVAAKTRTARFPLDSLARRTVHATWRRAETTVVAIDGDWLRLRLRRPDADAVAVTGAQCVERGRYEVWAPRAELTELVEVDIDYPDIAPSS